MERCCWRAAMRCWRVDMVGDTPVWSCLAPYHVVTVTGACHMSLSFVVSSTRPNDPSKAPPVIVSTKANPPSHFHNKFTLSLPPTPPVNPKPKTWASLFASSSSGLPTSSVVGISIHASTSTPQIPVPYTKKNELLNLLTNGPRAVQKRLEKINTRGLVNSGNMCFANAVLQVLVYCSPFQRLFIVLGKLLLSYSPPSPSPSTVNGTQLNGHRQKSQTPFIDATVQFLREFIDDASPTQFAAAKGKQREIPHANHEEEEENEWFESFLPWYVYDAMKENKRFENMRVRPLPLVRPHLTHILSGRSTRRRRRVPRVLSRHARRRTTLHPKFTSTSTSTITIVVLEETVGRGEGRARYS